MSIPIENLYYLLSYAWNKLEEKDNVYVSLDGAVDSLCLLTRILVSGTHNLLKRGLEKNYVSNSMEVAGVKGKILLAETLKTGVFLRQKTVCMVDEFREDILPNQILLFTFRRLLRTDNLGSEQKSQIRRILRKLPKITYRNINKKDFYRVEFHRNNRIYEFLIHICALLFEQSLPGEQEGDWKFIDFTRDERKMNQLYEAFLLQFYKRHYPQWNISSRVIHWQLKTIRDENDIEHIPIMKTDITIDKEETRMIIDAKYYKETLNRYKKTEKIKSGNLYQLFSYLINQRDGTLRTEEATGILLYPTIRQEYDLEYQYQSHKIYIKTVNLNTPWYNIEKRLHKIVSG